MKVTIMLSVFSWLMLVSILVNAQEADMYQTKIDNFKTMKTVGIVLIGASVPLGAIGAYMMVDANRKIDEENWGGFFSGTPELFWGFLVACLAGISLAGGTVMTIIGDKKMREYKSKQDGLKVEFYCAPQHAGFTLSYRF